MKKNGRNKDIEMLRGVAMLLILFYHYTQIIPGIMSTHWLQMIDEGFCQIAMVLFFSISGFGSYIYLTKSENKGLLFYVKKRFYAIAPQYYFCLIILLFTVSANLLAWNQILKVGAFFSLIQNLFVSTNTIINGATWTIALMMQFYLIAPLIYKLVYKHGIKIYAIALVFTFFMRMLISAYLYKNNAESFSYVVYSIRQIYTTVDIFIGGMLAGKSLIEQKKGLSILRCRLSFVLLFVGILITFMMLIYTPVSNYVWGANIRSWLWPPILGIEVAFLLYICTGIKFKYQSIPGRFIQFIAKNEYGIYLWHMPLISSLAANAPMYAGLLERNKYGLLIIMIILAIMIGKASNNLSNYIINNKQHVNNFSLGGK